MTANEELMGLVEALESGNVWAVGRFDALAGQARLPGDLASRLPSITWFSATGSVNGGISGVLRAEARTRPQPRTSGTSSAVLSPSPRCRLVPARNPRHGAIAPARRYWQDRRAVLRRARGGL